jgi:hypothetical protein
MRTEQEARVLYDFGHGKRIATAVVSKVLASS